MVNARMVCYTHDGEEGKEDPYGEGQSHSMGGIIDPEDGDEALADAFGLRAGI